jgi:hypothetical protein
MLFIFFLVIKFVSLPPLKFSWHYTFSWDFFKLSNCNKLMIVRNICKVNVIFACCIMLIIFFFILSLPSCHSPFDALLCLTLYSSSNGFSLGKPAAFSRLNWNTLYLLLKKGYSLIRIRIFNVVHLIIVLCKTASWLWKPCICVRMHVLHFLSLEYTPTMATPPFY